MLNAVTVTSGSASRTGAAGVSRGPAIPTTRAICPYLIADDGTWRRATASRDQRCAVVVPPAALAVDKQRRLCLVDAHRTCATYLAALTAADGMDGDAHAGARGRATRWSLVRTAPVVLDRGRGAAAVARRGNGSQIALGGLMVLAFASVVLARLGPAGPSLAGAVDTGHGSPSAAATPAHQRPARAVASPPGIAGHRSPAVETSAAPIGSTAAAPVAPARTHRVVAGDTLYALAIRFDTTVRALMKKNGLSSSELRIGRVLRIP